MADQYKSDLFSAAGEKKKENDQSPAKMSWNKVVAAK